jgi:hypothetical protein
MLKSGREVGSPQSAEAAFQNIRPDFPIRVIAEHRCDSIPPLADITDGVEYATSFSCLTFDLGVGRTRDNKGLRRHRAEALHRHKFQPQEAE